MSICPLPNPNTYGGRRRKTVAMADGKVMADARAQCEPLTPDVSGKVARKNGRKS